MFDAVVDFAKKAVLDRRVQAVAGLVVACKVISTLKAASARNKFFAEVKKQQKGVLHIYGPPRVAPGTPNFQPWVAKIEAFARLNKIPYVIHFGMDFVAYSPTETVPFIALDGELVGDSEAIIEFLSKKFNSSLDAKLTKEQVAIRTTLRRTLEHSMMPHSYRLNMVDNVQVMVGLFSKVVSMPGFVVKMAINQYRKGTIKRLNASGIGDMSDAVYTEEYTRDIKAIEGLIGDKKFIFGAEPTSIDLAIYPHLAFMTSAQGHTKNTQPLEFLRGSKIIQEYIKRCEQTIFPDLGKIVPCKAGEQSFLTYPITA